MLTFEGKQFRLNGKDFQIKSGAIHYFRIMPEYWADTLKKLKACGLNTVETYIPWNLTEKIQGQFDFSGILNITHFLDLAKKEGLYAIIRPGPYICAELDFGGLPSWLLKDPNMKIRCMYKPYLDAVDNYLKKISSIINPYMHTNGGNVIALQVENEYGSFGNDKNYLNYIEDLFRKEGIVDMLFTSDGPDDNMLSGGTLKSLMPAVNFGSMPNFAFRTAKKHKPMPCPDFCAEYWDGWFDSWGTYRKEKPTRALAVAKDVEKMLNDGASFNLYMFIGGTNFGFTAGATDLDKYSPICTSYDYDALLNEWGGYTAKYHAVRKVLTKNMEVIPELPPEPSRQNIGEIALTDTADFYSNFDMLGKKYSSISSDYMEFFNQSFGFINYRTKLCGTYHGNIFLEGLHDNAYIFLNGKLLSKISRNDKKQSVKLHKISGENTLDVLVEAMGRINYGYKMPDRKGIKTIRIGQQTLFNYEIFTLPLENLDGLNFKNNAKKNMPKFLKGNFKTESNASCFIHTDKLSNGIIFINGFNLGRYRKIGPQEALYIPGCILKSTNEIIILDLDGSNAESIIIDSKPNLKKKRKFLI